MVNTEESKNNIRKNTLVLSIVAHLFIGVFRRRELSNRSLWYHEEMNRSLRVDVMKCNALPRTKHPTSQHLPPDVVVAN